VPRLAESLYRLIVSLNTNKLLLLEIYPLTPSSVIRVRGGGGDE
jgi:hypothetical protein